MDIVTRVAQDTAGNVASEATITVYVGDSMTLAALFEDAEGAEGKMNPFTAGIFGEIQFYAHDNLLRIEATKLDGVDVIELGILYHRVITPETVMLRALNGADIIDKPAFRATIGAAAATDLGNYILLSEKAAAFGVATLDENLKIPIAQIPQAVQGIAYQGTWDASSGLDPEPLDDVPLAKGMYWIVNVPGATELPGGEDEWKEKDWVVYNGLIYDKVDNTDAVASVNGMLGTVVLDYDDVGADPAGAAATAQSNAATFTTTAIGTHSAAVDPHGDRAYTDSELADHVADVDPHGDRAYADDAITDHSAAVDPHGDRAYADTEIANATNNKAEILALTPIADPLLATPEDCANASNAIIAALQA